MCACVLVRALAVIKSKSLIESTAKCPRTHILKNIGKWVCVCMCVHVCAYKFVLCGSNPKLWQLSWSAAGRACAVRTRQTIHKRSASLKPNTMPPRVTLEKHSLEMHLFLYKPLWSLCWWFLFLPSYSHVAFVIFVTLTFLLNFLQYFFGCAAPTNTLTVFYTLRCWNVRQLARQQAFSAQIFVHVYVCQAPFGISFDVEHFELGA